MTLRFNADVPAAARTMLQAEYRDYTKTTAMIEEELRALSDWVGSGHSPWSNPYNLANESGAEFDFVGAVRLIQELAAEEIA
ncbi:MAG: hypothetical protein J6P40_11075 [Oscillospiraceae bacterium]|nr:hypothetical protein [Oscillospiraceae bacterium]